MLQESHIHVAQRLPVGDVTGTTMKKTLTYLLAIATLAAAMAATATDASAQWRGRGGGWHGGGWRGSGWGPGVAAGVVGGAVIAGAIIASRPQGYVVYQGYSQPVYGPGCYWASEPVYDGLGRVVGYTGRPVQVCPGYVPPPPPATRLCRTATGAAARCSASAKMKPGRSIRSRAT